MTPDLFDFNTDQEIEDFINKFIEEEDIKKQDEKEFKKFAINSIKKEKICGYTKEGYKEYQEPNEKIKAEKEFKRQEQEAKDKLYFRRNKINKDIFLILAFHIPLMLTVFLFPTSILFSIFRLITSIILLYVVYSNFKFLKIYEKIMNHDFFDNFLESKKINFLNEYRLEKMTDDLIFVYKDTNKIEKRKSYIGLKWNLNDQEYKAMKQYYTEEKDEVKKESSKIIFNEEQIKDPLIKALIKKIIKILEEIDDKSGSSLQSIKRIYIPSIQELISKYLELENKKFLDITYKENVKNDLQEIIKELENLINDDRVYETIEVESISKMMLMKVKELKNDFK